MLQIHAVKASAPILLLQDSFLDTWNPATCPKLSQLTPYTGAMPPRSSRPVCRLGRVPDESKPERTEFFFGSADAGGQGIKAEAKPRSIQNLLRKMTSSQPELRCTILFTGKSWNPRGPHLLWLPEIESVLCTSSGTSWKSVRPAGVWNSQ